jgi:hypothetical protein
MALIYIKCYERDYITTSEDPSRIISANELLERILQGERGSFEDHCNTAKDLLKRILRRPVLEHFFDRRNESDWNHASSFSIQ